MSESDTPTTSSTEQSPDRTQWSRMPDAEPIRVRDPLAELLGMVPEGEPLVVTFADVATAAGHACPAVAGAYRGTQLALDSLYPDAHPIRSDVAVTVGGAPDDPGLGPMAAVIRHVTGAADETGFAGLAGVGSREDLLSFGAVDAPGRAFRFERTDDGSEVVVSFDPSAAGVDPDDAGVPSDDGPAADDDLTDADPEGGGPAPMRALRSVASGEASEQHARAFREQWHDRVQRILDAPPEGGPFTVEERS